MKDLLTRALDAHGGLSRGHSPRAHTRAIIAALHYKHVSSEETSNHTMKINP